MDYAQKLIKRFGMLMEGRMLTAGTKPFKCNPDPFPFECPIMIPEKYTTSWETVVFNN